MKNSVLVGFAEALAAPEVVWSLVDNGFKVAAFSRKGRRSALRHSRHVTCHDITPPEMNLRESLSDLRSLMASLDKDTNGTKSVLFPLDDAAVWLSSRFVPDPPWMLAGPCGNNANLALDKNVQVQAARDAGFQVPETKLVTTSEEVLTTTNEFPVILKPSISVSPIGSQLQKGSAWICANRIELERAVAKWDNRVSLLVQPFISGSGEGVFGFATDKGILVWSGHKRLRMMNPHGSGSSACISQAVSVETRPPVEKLIEKAKWRGLFMIELLRDRSGAAWFMELNGRPWGSMALARKQGLEYPAWNVMLAIDGQATIPTNSNCTPGVVCRNLGRELIHPLFVLRGPKSEALSNWPSFWKAVSDVIRFRLNDSLYNWRKDDAMVLVADCFYTFTGQVFKRTA